VFLIGPLLFSIELIGLFIRPVTLSLRLTGNIFGDHTVFGIMSDLVPIGVPVIFLGLGSFVAFMQAFVFSLLSTIYIGLSLPHHEHAHAGDDHASH
jgi:F-type H+-transporting ATPase subunit a